MKLTTKNRGFIALITVIIISVVLLGLVSVSNTAGYFNRFDELDTEYKRIAFALAESCANTALLDLAQNYAYAPAQSIEVPLGSDSCTILFITTTSNSPYSRTVLITTWAAYQGAFSTVQVGATIANPSSSGTGSASTPAVTINSWQEVN